MRSVKFAFVSGFVLMSVVLAGCASSSVDPLPDPPAVKTPPTSSDVPDSSGTSLVPVRGATTTTAVAIRPGGATIRGRVLTSGGAASGARVRVERLVNDKTAAVDVVANNDGAYVAEGLIGGRYRVRAYRPPDSTMAAAQVFFLGNSENKSLDLNLDRFAGGTDIRASINPSPPFLGQGGTLSVTLTSRGVDTGGVARSLGSGGVVMTLVSAGGRGIVSANPVRTDPAGRAQWALSCNSQDNQGLSVILEDGSSFNVNVAGCEPPPPETTLPPEETPVEPAAPPQ